ncbi:MAG: hypothetical protein PF588_03065, partial [Candidatus Kapabacteria bacterium]|nr:hypothetical protein [Candidatus Kapabacteria bacterium]
KYPNFGEKPLEVPADKSASVNADRKAKEDKHKNNRNNEILTAKLKNTPSIENAVTAAEAGATLSEIVDYLSFDSKSESAEKFDVLNIPAMFEVIRAKADKYESDQGKKPMIFAATMGTVRQHKGRFDFAADFFKVGGFDISYSKGYDSVDEAVKAFEATSAKAVVICSTDDNYPEIVPTLAA